ncbi:MAG: ATP-binding protein, partial [Cyanobacteria bacterium P01_H01_bin.119]
MATDSDRKAQFNEAYRNLNLFPLVEADEIEKFRVAYAGLTLGTLETDILASTVGDKLIFTGHRGCGKSTLLN